MMKSYCGLWIVVIGIMSLTICWVELCLNFQQSSLWKLALAFGVSSCTSSSSSSNLFHNAIVRFSMACWNSWHFRNVPSWIFPLVKFPLLSILCSESPTSRQTNIPIKVYNNNHNPSLVDMDYIYHYCIAFFEAESYFLTRESKTFSDHYSICLDFLQESNSDSVQIHGLKIPTDECEQIRDTFHHRRDAWGKKNVERRRSWNQIIISTTFNVPNLPTMQQSKAKVDPSQIVEKLQGEPTSALQFSSLNLFNWSCCTLSWNRRLGSYTSEHFTLDKLQFNKVL